MSAPPALPSRRPYLLRAMHEWMGDAGLTPHIIVDATRPGVVVPAAHVKDGKIVLNISMSATQHLQLKNDQVTFAARFGGVAHQIQVPVAAVLGIYARETGEGMVFNDSDPETPPPAGQDDKREAAASVPSLAARRARLKVVK
jgi:stringent starvation protein B